jgi:hypothetical protein
MEFIFERLRNKNPDGSLQIMYTIHGMGLLRRQRHSSRPLTGGKDLEEIELPHLDGHKGSKPVRYEGRSSKYNMFTGSLRIGNGAANHLQLDIYGELMDCVYLGQKVIFPSSSCSCRAHGISVRKAPGKSTAGPYACLTKLLCTRRMMIGKSSLIRALPEIDAPPQAFNKRTVRTFRTRLPSVHR